MGQSFVTICRELADGILEYMGHSPGSVLGQWGNKEYISLMQHLKESEIYCGM
jgi:hypothetical protein